MTEKSKKTIIYSVIGGAALLIGYAFFSLRKQILLAKQMKFSFVGANVLPNIGKDMGVKIKVAAENKSNFTIVADVMNFDIYLNGIYINKILQKTSQQINPESKSIIEFNVYFNPLQVLQGLKIENVLKAIDYKNLNLKIVGYFSGSVDGISFTNYPFEIEDKLGNLLGK